MRSCVFVVGTRAQLIKVAPVLRQAAAEGLPHTLWLAGQHNESIDELIEDFELDSPVILPATRKERSSIVALLAWLPGMLWRCRRFIRATARRTGQPPLVVVHGDTLSTLTGALAARLANAPLVHMESGLTSGRLFNPFPEEAIRRITFRLARYALCPSAAAVATLKPYRVAEAVDCGENTLLDGVRYVLERRTPASGSPSRKYFVASIHRFENIYNRAALADIVGELSELSAHGTVHFVLHPPTVKRLARYGLLQRLEAEPRIRLAERMPYTRFLALLAGARAVISDGGSNQEELSWLGVPTVLFRQRSERPDGLGQNIVFRHQVDGTLGHFLLTGGLDRLRRPALLDDRLQPSAHALAALKRWASS